MGRRAAYGDSAHGAGGRALSAPKALLFRSFLPKGVWWGTLTLATFVLGGASQLSAQVPVDGEVRQLVTFRFLPGMAAEANALYRAHAIPLYEQDEAMLSFRALREVESPVPLDLIVISSFQGMAGMDESNAALRRLAEASGSSIGAIYGNIGQFTESHHDQFVEMLAPMINGDPSAKRLVTLVWYRVLPGEASSFERALEMDIVPWERRRGVPTSTGRFLVSDGWSYLRFLGFDSLADYQAYWTELGAEASHRTVEEVTALRREVILAPVPELSVR